MSQELQRAADRLARDHRVLAVYGFGSRARGEASPKSDVDVERIYEALHEELGAFDNDATEIETFLERLPAG